MNDAWCLVAPRIKEYISVEVLVFVWKAMTCPSAETATCSEVVGFVTVLVKWASSLVFVLSIS
jgi:hypothetical protein